MREANRPTAGLVSLCVKMAQRNQSNGALDLLLIVLGAIVLVAAIKGFLMGASF